MPSIRHRDRGRSVRTFLGVVVATALATTAVPLSPASAAGELSVQRIAGPDRYATAAALARTAYPDGADAVVVASGETFPDALAATSLAGALKAPVLLARSASVPEASSTALRDLHPRRLVIVGGTSRISDDVVGRLRDAAGTTAVQRISGPDRYATSALVSASLPLAGIGRVDGQRTALLATGERFPDALAAGSVAAAAGLPLLLTPPDALPPQVGAAMTAAGVTQVVLLGGEASISAGVADAVRSQGIATQRLGGTDRQATAATVADWASRHAGLDAGRAALARGDDAGGGADALALGPLAALRRAPVLLAESPGRAGGATTSWAAAHGATLTALDVAGGQGAVSDDVLDEVRRAATSGAATPRGDGPGSLVITVAGLSAGAAAVGISGPGGYYARATGTVTLTGLTEGTYRLTAEPVRLPAGATGAAATAFASVVPPVVVGRGATSTTVTYGTQVPDTTEVVPPVAVQTITGPAGGTRQLVVDAAVAPTVAVGEIVAVGSTPAEPAGVLGRVVAQQGGGASTRLTVAPVDLRDAVPVADFDATLPAERVEATVDSDAAATSTVPSARAEGLGAADQRSAAGDVLPANRWKPECSATAEASLTAEVSLEPVFLLDGEWSLGGVKTLDVSAGLTGSTSLSAGVSAEASCAAGDYVKLKNLKPITFTVGVVPVVLVPQVGLNLAYEAKVGAASKVSLGSTTDARFGRRWDGTTWTPHNTLGTTYTAGYEGPAATGTLEASAGPQFTLLVYGLAGPSLSLTAGPVATVSTKDPVWAVDAEAHGEVGLASPVFGLQKDVAEVFRATVHVAQAGGDGAGVCTGIAACRQVTSIDVDGDGRPDDVALVGETPDEGTVGVRVRTVSGVLTASVPHSFVGPEPLWKGATDIDGVPGAELVVLQVAGVHTLFETVLTVRDQKLVVLPWPEGDEQRGPEGTDPASWIVDGAHNSGLGITCSPDRTVTVAQFFGSGGDVVQVRQRGYRWHGPLWELLSDSGTQSVQRDAVSSEYFGWHCGDLAPF